MYSGKDWPHPWDSQRHPVDYRDIVERLEMAGKLLGGPENPYAELYYSAAREISELRAKAASL